MDNDLPVRSVSRAIELLQYINREDGPTLLQLQHLSGLPYPTVGRLVKSLALIGLVEATPSTKRYYPTGLVLTLSSGFQEDDQLAESASPVLSELTRTLNWPTSLAIRVGGRMMIKQSTHRETSLVLSHYNAGFTLPLTECASGLAYLAFCNEDERDTILAGLKDHHPASSTKGTALAKRIDSLEKIRDLGYATFDRTMLSREPGKTSSIAVPVLVNDVAVAAVALVFFASAMKMSEAIEKYVTRLQEAANEIGRLSQES
ncbi:MAG: helix-turn-helix domain-containing protein [Rhodospirillaceae bacterium]